jgi:hypothetical protein
MKNPFPELPPEPPVLPMVYVKQAVVWEYRQLTRDLAKEKTPTEEELNELGQDGWELAGVLNESGQVHFYFKRMVGG